MKNYLKFNLDPKKLLPFWLLFLFVYILPYLKIYIDIKQLKPGEMLPGVEYAAFGLILIAVIAIYYFFIKISINSLGYQDKFMNFDGSYILYLGKCLLGVFLSAITLGIYSPWFAKDLTRYFAENTSYNTNRFNFLGRGRDLLLIMTLSLILPMIVLGVFSFLLKTNSSVLIAQVMIQLVTFLIVIPYTYLAYKWMVNFSYKCFHFSWDTRFFNSCGKILMEMFLTAITCGIYFPLAYVRLYKYFIDKTIAISPEKNLKFGFEMKPGEDFLFIWGQTLLTIITLTIYTPWAVSKTGKRFIGRTFIESEDED